METELDSRTRPGERPRAALRVYLLGRFEVVRGDAPLPAQAWRRRRPADLLKLVALAPGRSLTREETVAALWPEKDPASGANNLHRALYDLRQILGGRWVDIERGRVHMRPDVWLDVDAFERAAATGGREGAVQAVALYRGDLSPEDLDSPWLHAPRVQLRARFADAALPIARTAVQDGEYALAVPLLRRLLEIDPGAEECHRLLLRGLAESGRPAEALRQYDACELALRGLARVPSEETRQLRAAIQRGEIGGRDPRASQDGVRRAARRLLGMSDPPPLRGRSAILLLLEALVESGSGALVLLGERGVGKTRLALEGARLAQARGAAVICGVAGLAPGAPWAVFADALREEARANPAVPDPFADDSDRAGTSGEPLRLAVLEAIERALRAAAQSRPILLILDDLHLADESSLNLLHLLARRAQELRLMVIATCDEEAIHAGTAIQMALTHLDGARLANGVRVSRLGLAGTREQVGDLLGAPPAEEAVQQIYRATDGSPLLVEEVVRALRESGQAVVPGDPAAAIRGRVARLGPHAEALLAAAAVAGTRFELEHVRAISGLSGPDATAALDACLEARLLDGDGVGCHFHHALVREAIYGGLPADRRAALHGALADLVEAQADHGEPPSALLAHHFVRAGREQRAFRHLVAAGHRAASRAGLREALSFLVAAHALSGREGIAGPEEQLELVDALGRVQLCLGELSGAAQAFVEAAQRCGPSGALPCPFASATAHRLAAVSLAAAGRLRAAHAEIDEGLAAAGEAPGDAAPLLEVRAQLLWHEGRDAEARAAAEACHAAALSGGDAELAARAVDLVAVAGGASGEPPAPPRDDPRAAARRAANALLDPPVPLHLVLWERDLLGDLGCAAVGRLAALHGERARLRGARDEASVGRFGEGAAALAAGRLDLADAALADALAGHRAVGSALGEALALERIAALLALRGRFDEALTTLDEGLVAAERSMLRRHALTRLHATETHIRLAAGATHAAEAAVREASEAAARHGECVVCDAAFRPEAVRVLIARGRLAEAEAEAAQLEEIARRRGGRGLDAVARATRGRVLAAQGHRAEARAALAAARAAFLAAGQRVEAARCARLETRLSDPGAPLPDEVRALEALVAAEPDA